MSLNMEKTFDSENRIWNLSICGEVDIYTANELKEELSTMITQNICDIVIQGKELDYIDSTGLGILIGSLKRLKENQKDIYIKNAKPNVKKIFNITGLDKIFKVEG